jgi:hypothetical protein
MIKAEALSVVVIVLDDVAVPVREEDLGSSSEVIGLGLFLFVLA